MVVSQNDLFGGSPIVRTVLAAVGVLYWGPISMEATI